MIIASSGGIYALSIDFRLKEISDLESSDYSFD